MKKLIVLLISMSFSCLLHAQGIIGAWETTSVSGNGDKLKSIAIFADGYQVLTTYKASTGEFVHTRGGTWRLDGNKLTELIEFDTEDPQLVGTELNFKVKVTNDRIEIADSKTKYKRIDSGTPGELHGAWLMSGRVKDGETQLRDTSGPRKTMKILSGTRFQWIAYNTETKQFMGTGGGTYTTNNGKYAEQIEFFSRDNSKAGLRLEFKYELIDGNWHHSGLSSKGDPIHEIWSIRD